MAFWKLFDVLSSLLSVYYTTLQHTMDRFSFLNRHTIGVPYFLLSHFRGRVTILNLAILWNFLLASLLSTALARHRNDVRLHKEVMI
jgi:hypothetical protein